MGQLKTNYTNLEEIGRGGFGVVYKAKCVANSKPWFGNIVAIKKVDISKVPGFRVGLELQALSKLHHENIVEFYEEFRENGAQFIVMEYCKYGSLRDYVKKNGRLSDQCAAFILRQLVNAVKHIHSSGMMHRDLSSGNVLISYMHNTKFRVKLADFGLATLLRQGDVTGTIVGTPGYIAPQVYGRSYNQKADVFSLGGIVYLMLMGKDPPREPNVEHLNLDGCSEEGAELIRQMMHPDETKRITLQDIRMSAFSRIADQFDVSGGNSFRDGSREQIRRSSREYYQLSYAQPVRVRAQSAQPRMTSNTTRMNKESGFESGGTDFNNIRRPSSENICRHSLYDGSVCRRCGMRRSIERPLERRILSNYGVVAAGANREGRSSQRSGRCAERRQMESRRDTIRTTMGSGVSTTNAALKTWPLDISRLAPNKLVIGAGRFFFNVDGTIVYEVAGRHRSMSRDNTHRAKNVGGSIDHWVVAVVVVNTKATDSRSYQQVSVNSCHNDRIPFPHPNDPPIHLDQFYARTYTSFEELKLDTSHLRFYRQIVEAMRRLGGRVEKIVFKPSANCTARLMENGDFRMKFSDGRLAVQKQGNGSVSVSSDASSKAILSTDEMNRFNESRSDALEMERILEKGVFLNFKPFPFHFSNTSLFTTSVNTSVPNNQRFVSEEDERRAGQGASERRPAASSVTRNCPSQEGNDRSGRKPLGNIDSNRTQFDRHMVQQQQQQQLNPKTNGSTGTENRQKCELETFDEDLLKPRMLREGEYKLRAQRDAQGKQVISSITTVNSEPVRSVRISTTSPNIFIYEVAGQPNSTLRFRFNGVDFSKIPHSARSLLYTLYRKRQEYA